MPEMDMSQEKKPKIRRLMPEGWSKAKITAAEENVSKSGNKMIVVELTLVDENYSEDVYLVSEPGKRWMLKKLLDACGCEAAQDGVYKWEFSDILDKEIMVLNIPEDNTWINREGEEKTTKQNRFTDFQEVAWDDDK